MPTHLPLNYVDVAYDTTTKQYMVWIIQRGHVTSSIVQSATWALTIAVIAKRLGCPVYTDDLDLTLALTHQGVAVIPDRFAS